jgi:CBS domain-containing protein
VEVTAVTTVRDVMTTSVLTAHRSTPLKEVARLLLENRISGVPVVDVDGAVLGVVSEADFLLRRDGDRHGSARTSVAFRHRPGIREGPLATVAPDLLTIVIYLAVAQAIVS